MNKLRGKEKTAMESSRNLSRIDPLFERNLSLEAVRISEAAAINCRSEEQSELQSQR